MWPPVSDGRARVTTRGWRGRRPGRRRGRALLPAIAERGGRARRREHPARAHEIGSAAHRARAAEARARPADATICRRAARASVLAALARRGGGLPRRAPKAIAVVRDAVAAAHGQLVGGTAHRERLAGAGRVSTRAPVAVRAGRAVLCDDAARRGATSRSIVGVGQRREHDGLSRAREQHGRVERREESRAEDASRGHGAPPASKRGAPSAVNDRPTSTTGLTRHGASSVVRAAPCSTT